MPEIRIFTKTTPRILKNGRLDRVFKILPGALLLWLVWFIWYINDILQGGLLKPIIDYIK